MKLCVVSSLYGNWVNSSCFVMCWIGNLVPNLHLMWGHLTLIRGLWKNHNRATQELGQNSAKPSEALCKTDKVHYHCAEAGSIKDLRPAGRNFTPAGLIISKASAAPSTLRNGYKLHVLFQEDVRSGEIEVNWHTGQGSSSCNFFLQPLKQELAFNCRWK